ncbi:MAG: mevalonate kinase [Flavobacteriaceae bacterium]|jgi:mevalonate kinase|tara:strand:- start:32 stop:952 length:921 start_codon:yes stop_codon:yes gene_type:complete
MENKTLSFYGRGKLLLTGEYAILNGARALALPCQKGQKLTFKALSNNELLWESFDVHENSWFKARFQLPSFTIINSSKASIALSLQFILKRAQELNPDFLRQQGGHVKTSLEFERQWGLGSSSTLVSSIAKWAGVNAYDLLEHSFGGSGYDLACAVSENPICYTRNGFHPIIEKVFFSPIFSKHLYFVYLNQKQSSLDAIKGIKPTAFNREIIQEIDVITDYILRCTVQESFNTLLEKHEEIIATVLQKIPVKERLFSDFDGAIKSLGAWGGDFIIASGDHNSPRYFEEKGFKTVIPYTDIIYAQK